MSPFRYIVVLLVGVMLTAGCAITPDGSFAKAFGESSTTISKNSGGSVDLFKMAAREVREKEWQVKIDGPCKSSCAIFADAARPNVCITERAVFGFHKMTVSSVLINPVTGVAGVNNMWLRGGNSRYEVKKDPPFAGDIADWVTAHGGFPTKKMLLMNSREASAFWPMCNK